MFTMSINDDVDRGLSGIIRALAAGFADHGAINKAVGRAAANLTRKHLYGLANTRHRPGVALNFYEDAADSVSDHDLGGGVEIRIDKAGMAQRFYGGRIEAVNYSHLWIPIAGTVAEGRSAGEFDGLVPIVNRTTRKGVALLDGEPVFALVESVDQAPDDSVLPSAAEYADAGRDAMDDYLDAMMSRNVETRAFTSKTTVVRDDKGRFKKERIR